MKTYSVKETADILGISEETVCRWIRLGKLKATAPERNDETTDENGMNEFVELIPAYAQSIASSISDIIVNSAKLVGAFVRTVRESDNTRYSSVDSEEVKRLLEERMEYAKTSINAKKQLLKKFEAEIQREEEKLHNSETQMNNAYESAEQSSDACEQ